MAELSGKLDEMLGGGGGNLGGVAILLVASCYRNRDNYARKT